MRKNCGLCGLSKPSGQFRVNSLHPDGLTRECKKCLRARDRKRRSRKDVGPPGKYSRQQRDYHLRSTFGISIEDYEQMLAVQGGACAICRTVQDRSLSVDHCHTTRRIRGLLCLKCNSMLGMAGERVSRLHRAVRYLDNFVSNFSEARALT